MDCSSDPARCIEEKGQRASGTFVVFKLDRLGRNSSNDIVKQYSNFTIANTHGQLFRGANMNSH